MATEPKYFLRDLEDMVKKGVILQETANDIRSYYAQRLARPGSSRFSVILGILGALLTGSGIVLVIAHNWELLSQTLKTAIAFLPLLLGQILCTFTLIRKRSDTVWRESSAVILYFGVAATISMISQIFHISGSLQGFLLTWLLLTLPLIYIFSSTMVAILAISTATWYVSLLGYGFESGIRSTAPFLYLAFIAFVIPHYYLLYKKDKGSVRVHFLNWFLAASLIVSWGAFSNSDTGAVWISFSYCCLFQLFFFIGITTNNAMSPLMRNPFLLSGATGMLIILMIWSFDSLWRTFSGQADSFSDYVSSPLFFLTLAAFLASCWLALRSSLIKNEVPNPLLFITTFFFIILVVFRTLPSMAAFVVNLLIIITAVYFIRKGSRIKDFGILNLGLSILATLAIFRFFDDSIPFVWRGIFFLGTGILFFTANLMLIRKRKSLISSKDKE